MTSPLAEIVVPDELEAGGATIMAVAVSIDHDLDELMRRLLPVADFWSGNSHLTWTDLQTMWNNASTALMTSVGTLGDVSRAVNTNWANYVDCEQTNTRTWAH
jgi:uncharacterized protein YukE